MDYPAPGLSGAGIVRLWALPQLPMVLWAPFTFFSGCGVPILLRSNGLRAAWVFVFFFGTPILCLLIIALTAFESAADGRLLLIAGAICYLAGPFGITVLFNVPLNNELTQAGPDEANDAWPSYIERWQRWNHIRTYVGVLSIALLSFGIAIT